MATCLEHLRAGYTGDGIAVSCLFTLSILLTRLVYPLIPGKLNTKFIPYIRQKLITVYFCWLSLHKLNKAFCNVIRRQIR